MSNKWFGFFEVIGSIILLLLDPNRRDTRKYLDPKYLKANRVVGIVTSVAIFGIAIYYFTKL